jgi:hypothetical protein
MRLIYIHTKDGGVIEHYISSTQDPKPIIQEILTKGFVHEETGHKDSFHPIDYTGYTPANILAVTTIRPKN